MAPKLLFHDVLPDDLHLKGIILYQSSKVTNEKFVAQQFSSNFISLFRITNENTIVYKHFTNSKRKEQLSSSTLFKLQPYTNKSRIKSARIRASLNRSKTFIIIIKRLLSFLSFDVKLRKSSRAL